MEKKPLTWIHYTAMGTGSGATLAGMIVGGYFLGSFMDRRFDSDPLWTVVGIFAALAFGIVGLVLMIGKSLKSESSKEPGNKP